MLILFECVLGESNDAMSSDENSKRERTCDLLVEEGEESADAGVLGQVSDVLCLPR